MSWHHQSLVSLNSFMVLNRLLSKWWSLKSGYQTKWSLKLCRSTHKKPVKVHHGTSGEQVWFKIYINCGPGDNPAQSKVCGHIGGNGNHPCRKCLVGRPQQAKETNNGFHSLFKVGNCSFVIVGTYWIETLRLVSLTQLKGSSLMSSSRWEWPVCVLLRMYRISRQKMASKMVTPNYGLMIS